MMINPWLIEQIRILRERHSEAELRKHYIHYPDRTWEQHLMIWATQDAMRYSRFNQTLLSMMVLPEIVKKGLYSAGVDCGADLLQLSQEELQAVARQYEFEADVVTRFLESQGCQLYSSPKRTEKLSALYGMDEKGNFPWEMWIIPSPGAQIDFKIDRPSLYPEWFDTFYKRYGHFDDEERGEQVLHTVRPPRLDGGKMPYDYDEFFQAARNLWDAYEESCQYSQLKPRVPRPKFPDEDVHHIYREGVKAVVDILERTMLLKKATKGKFLSGSDEQKLSIVEEVKPESFQLLLISLVELKIDIENIVIYLDECRRGKHKADFERVSHQVNPKIAKMILRLRQIYSDNELRKRYREELQQSPNLSWEEYIVQAALAEP